MKKFNDIIQIAGIANKKEAELLIANGVKYLGFPLRLTVNKEDLTEDEAREIISGFPKNVHGVLITYLDKADEIISLARKIGADTVQIHGEIEIAEIEILKKKAGDLFLIKSLVIRQNNFEELVRKISLFTPFANAFITDTYDPETGAEGATGKTHDWEISKRIVELSELPVILAGGLNPDNVAEAIRFVNPAGVDVHTGVEDKDGKKDERLVKKFVENARKEFAKRKAVQQ